MAVKPGDLLSKPLTADYDPKALLGMLDFQSRRPRFTHRWVYSMLRDQRIQFGLKVIKGPIIASSRFFVQDEDSGDAPEEYTELKRFVVKNMTQFWRWSAVKALRAVEWGYDGSEALYRIRGDQICFEALKVLHPKDVRVVTLDGEKIGVSVRNVPGRKGKVYLGGPKGFWHVHAREESPWYGRSKLFGAFDPWLEFYTDGGAKDTRRLYYHKFAYNGEKGYYPTGHKPSQTEYPGSANGKDVMRSIMEKRRAGAPAYFPNTRDEDGNRVWEIEDATAGPGTSDMLEYHGDLKEEIFEGMGIPNEVVVAAETGSGWSGRKVPQTAFFSTLQEIVNWLVFDFDQQVIRPLVKLNFGIENPEYDIIPFGLLHGTGEEEEGEREANNLTPGQRAGARRTGVTLEQRQQQNPELRMALVI